MSVNECWIDKLTQSKSGKMHEILLTKGEKFKEITKTKILIWQNFVELCQKIENQMRITITGSY